MAMRILARSAVLAGTASAALLLRPGHAEACGGLFCSSPNLPINQAAEKIIFSANADNTVTAVIQIAYQGPATKFSWLLPISSVPKAGQIGVASNLAFARLQTATNPQYSLTVRVDGTCSPISFPTAAGGFADAGAVRNADGGTSPGDAVTVDASGMIGSFNYDVISVDPSSPDRAQAAVTWLTANGYNVGAGAPGLIRPYLEDGLHLLALRLSKGADTGSIRPLMLTYDGKSPAIPIKLTAVAANNDMGVMTWVLGSSRAVPQNYNALELNEARINWFNASSNYNAVVTAAADESGGQGFVTEYAKPGTALAQTVWSSSDEARWQSTQTAVSPSLKSLFDSVYGQWGQWDGFWDAARSVITLPAGVSFADFKSCPDCYSPQFAPSALIGALALNVIQPVKDVQALLDRNAYVTRLYTTMSADEMTADPLFTFNSALPQVSNVHTAVRVIECSPDLNQFQAPWHIELPGGGVVRGTGSGVGTWPGPFGAQPANQRIMRLGASGTGMVLEDNSATIQTALASYNATIPGATVSDGGSTDAGNTTDATIDADKSTSDVGTGDDRDAASATVDANAEAGVPLGIGGSGLGGGGPSENKPADVSGGGCAVSATHRPTSRWLLAATAALLYTAKRRRRGVEPRAHG